MNAFSSEHASRYFSQALGSRWYLIQASGVLGYSCKMREDGICVASLQYSSPDTRVCGTEWLRYDTEGQPLLVHHAKHMNIMTEFEFGKVDTSWQLIVEHTNTLNPVAAGIAGGGYSVVMKVPDGSKQRSLSSGGYCLELDASNVVVNRASRSLGNVQWLFYQVVNRNFGQPLNMPRESIICPHAPEDAGLVLMDKETQFGSYSGISLNDVRPKFLGMHVPCLCLFLVGKMSDPKTLCLDRHMRQGCVVYDLGVQHERIFASSMRRLGCEVHSYDPTMLGVTKKDWFESTGGAVFHDVGVASFNGIVEGIGNVQTVASMMKENAHNVIDYLKIDVESFEWDTLFEMHSSGILERIGAIQMEVHFWNKACFAHWVEWEKMWSPLGYPSDSSSSRACTNKNAQGSAASDEDVVIWQNALNILRDSGFQQISLQVVGGGQMVEFPNGEVHPCCYEINLVRPNWNGMASSASPH